ncbi:MAG: PPOX class F420-dependent oxidoreductase [Thaumarchaeota archaeon]|nr:PPOX class F420-dependent oxidoreductase [Nitrososphaerota archaeon]
MSPDTPIYERNFPVLNSFTGMPYAKSKLINHTPYYMAEIQDLKDEKYISLETYKKDGSVVRTPVWFVLQNNTLYVVTRQSTGKVKRLSNNQDVKLAACTIKGNITGQWHDGVATRLPKDESGSIVKLRDKKYGFMAKIAKFASRGKGDFVVYLINLKQ